MDLREERVGRDRGFITLIAMPTAHNETHYRADVVRLVRLKRHAQPYRSEKGRTAGGRDGGKGERSDERKVVSDGGESRVETRPSSWRDGLQSKEGKREKKADGSSQQLYY